MSPAASRKFRIPVSYDLIGNSMITKYIITKEPGSLFGVTGLGTRNKIRPLGEPIDYHHYHIMSFRRRRQANDKIHHQTPVPPCRELQNRGIGQCFCIACVYTLASITALDITANISGLFSPTVGAQAMDRLRDSMMTCGGAVMRPLAAQI